MKLPDIADLPAVAQPWEEGDNIPWDEPGFSQRMLQEHLSQDHSAASRRLEEVEACVSWIHHELLGQRPGRVLDLCCGPGLYASRLARLGHRCVGVDYSPASIAYAKKTAQSENLDCTYVQQDVRTAEYGTDFQLVMLIYGELNVFRANDTKRILKKAHEALTDGGVLLLEPHPFSVVRQKGKEKQTWYFANSGVFSSQPYLCLEQHFWDDGRAVATTRFLVVDAHTSTVKRYALSAQAYTNEQFHRLLAECGFLNVRFLPSITGSEQACKPDMIGIVGEKAGIRN